MSSYDRNNAINTNYENELNKRQARNNNHINQTHSKVIIANDEHNKQHQEVPTPEPRRKLTSHGPQQALTIKYNGDKLENELAINNDKHEAKLVKIKYNPNQDLPQATNNTNIDNHAPANLGKESKLRSSFLYTSGGGEHQQKRTSFNEMPVEFVTDEGVSSPTNVDYDDENDTNGYSDLDEEGDNDIDDDDDDYRASESTGELAHLSRQSMVPLHELIAYYQYIQHADSGSIVSRQSSSASKHPTTTRTKHSQLNADIARKLSVSTDENNKDDNKILNETNSNLKDIPIVRLHAPQLLSKTNTESAHSGDPREEEEEEGERDGSVDENEISDDPSLSSAQKAVSSCDKKRIRANVILELINSERDFVKHLKDVVEGYLFPARRHPEIFTGDRINTIFANIEQLYEFQRKFLECLEAQIVWDDLARSQVGQCFLEFEKGFSVYHHYCNNHPNATSELQELYTKPRFVKFFEACRLIQNMIDISLDGFLLTPIQKICKYPLQLTELLKNTDQDHPDYNYVADALESMRNCANVANERKRRIEALADIMSFQEKIENWFGPKLSDTSSILIHSGEVSKMNSHTWSQNVQLYLFDHSLLYCKKDLLKRNCLILRGRISMDFVTEISDADEYKAKKSFKLYCSEQQKWFVFVTRSEKEKDEWIRAFERERNLVETDENEGFQITEREICVARRALQNRKHSRSARYRHKRPDTAIVDHLDLDDANMIMNRTLSLPSCIHPNHVMNFVEDSRVVPARKKNASPNASSRSPNVAGSQLSTQQQHQQQPQGVQQHPDQVSASGGWFKKMGSKKLSKSQVYNVNGQTGVQQQLQQNATSPSIKPTHTSSASPTINILATAASIVSDDSAAIKFDQLERRHREHMISEEQARLFRLNNDLPAQVPVFNRCITPTTVGASKSPTTTMSRHEQQHGAYQISPASSGQARWLPQTQTNRPRSNELMPKVDRDPQDLNFQSLNINQTNQRHQRKPDGAATFEATVQLSSGRVVKVREDSV